MTGVRIIWVRVQQVKHTDVIGVYTATQESSPLMSLLTGHMLCMVFPVSCSLVCGRHVRDPHSTHLRL